MTTLDDDQDRDPIDAVAALRVSTAEKLKPLKGRVCKTILQSPTTEIKEDELPAIAVMIGSSSGAALSESQPEYRLSATITIDCIVKAETHWATKADALSFAVMVRLFRDAEWTEQFEQTPTFERATGVDNQGGMVCGSTLTITATLKDCIEFWPRDLGELRSIHGDVDLAEPSPTDGPDGIPEASFIVEVQE